MRKELLLAPLVGALAAASFFLLTNNPAVATRAQGALCVPREGIAKIFVGEKAIEMVRSIHWNPEALKGIVNATVVFYSDGSVLWETKLKDEKTAETLLSRMLNAIKKNQGKIPYLSPVEHKINGTTIYFIADVRGPAHALFRKGDVLVWLQFGRNGMQYLKELLRCG
ncbi:MAG: hypothetical protein GXO07_03640 [Crenarchaeota archaeon]|nr:hypothetical protein [Thermoproteota archaeon]